MQNAFIGYLAAQIKGVVDRLVRLVDRLVLIVDRLVLPYQFIHSRPSSRYVSVGKEVEELLISLSIKEKIMRQRDSNKGGLEEGWGSPKSKLLDDLVSKLSQAAIKPSTNVNKNQL